ncbi:MAG TPA: MATE family efflux transporter [Ruminococcus sp.]|nr:MATE family efflux transporter [Ruminococcus sp.]
MEKREIRNKFFQYIFFNIISTLGVSVYILIDTYFISKGMGADGLAALNLCLPVFNFINGIGLMLGMGGGSKFSMLYCRVERSETDKIYSNAFFAALAAAGLFEMVGLFFSKQFTAFLGADSSIFEMSHVYLKTILLFAPAFILNNLLVCFMRNDSAPRLAMAGVLGGSLVNVILDYVFIIRMGLGMKGAALATCISPLVSMCIMGIHFLTGWNAFQVRMVKPSLSIIQNIASLGMYSLVTEWSGGIVIMVFNFVLYRMLNNTGIAAYGIVTNLAIVFTAIFTGLSSGVQPLMCSVHGKGDTDAAKYLLRLSITTASILAAAAYAAVYLNTTELVSIFNNSGDDTLRSLAENGLRLYFLYLPFMGLNSIFSVYFSSGEYTFSSQLLSFLRGTVLVIPLAFLFYYLRSANGIWLTVPIAELLTAAVGIVINFYIAKPYELYEYHYVPKVTNQYGSTVPHKDMK